MHMLENALFVHVFGCMYMFELTVSYRLVNYSSIYVTAFGKNDHNVTNDISRNTDLKY